MVAVDCQKTNYSQRLQAGWVAWEIRVGHSPTQRCGGFSDRGEELAIWAMPVNWVANCHIKSCYSVCPFKKWHVGKGWGWGRVEWNKGMNKVVKKGVTGGIDVEAGIKSACQLAERTVRYRKYCPYFYGASQTIWLKLVPGGMMFRFEICIFSHIRIET